MQTFLLMLVSASFSLLHVLSKVPKFFSASPPLLPSPHSCAEGLKRGGVQRWTTAAVTNCNGARGKSWVGLPGRGEPPRPQAPPHGWRPEWNGRGRGARAWRARGWASRPPLEAWGGVGEDLLPHSLSGRAAPLSRPSSSLSHPSEWSCTCGCSLFCPAQPPSLRNGSLKPPADGRTVTACQGSRRAEAEAEAPGPQIVAVSGGHGLPWGSAQGTPACSSAKGAGQPGLRLSRGPCSGGRREQLPALPGFLWPLAGPPPADAVLLPRVAVRIAAGTGNRVPPRRPGCSWHLWHPKQPWEPRPRGSHHPPPRAAVLSAAAFGTGRRSTPPWLPGPAPGESPRRGGGLGGPLPC